MAKRIAILQSNYIPWKGYFDQVAAVDEFILYDDVQYTKNDWRNRNQIKTPQGPVWLTVPVKVKGRTGQTIRQAEIDGTAWAEKHWKTLCRNYARAPYFTEVSQMLEPYYMHAPAFLSELNFQLIQAVCGMLAITTKIRRSSEYALVPGQTERLVDLCRQVGATEYISGPSAKEYIVPRLFENAGIALSWFDYDGYPEYPQLWGTFTHRVSILDLLFNCGPQARRYMKCGEAKS